MDLTCLIDSQLKGLEKEGNGLVAKYLVNAQINKSVGTKLRINPEWLGICLKNFKNQTLLNKAKTFKPY